ncbi:MAG: BspA family leucine-rich repeat surface protein [Lachnospiraceae bacterium]|nr:BspA family leucine-rich repeat surface protein [Lachnospiraceae bacterium]
MRKNRGALTFIMTLAMLTAELQPLAMPMMAHAEEPEYELVSEETEEEAVESEDEIEAAEAEEFAIEEAEEAEDETAEEAEGSVKEPAVGGTEDDLVEDDSIGYIHADGEAEIVAQSVHKDGYLDWILDSNGLMIFTGEGIIEHINSSDTLEEQATTEAYKKAKKISFDAVLKYYPDVVGTGVLSKGIGTSFMDFPNLEEVDLTGFDTKEMTSASMLFSLCRNLKSIELGGLFTTENVTDMYLMFNWCDKLESIDLSKIDTRNVTTMQDMFAHCTALKDIDVSSMRTDSLTNISGMFRYTGLEKINFGQFNTSNVTKMGSLFAHSTDLREIDLSSFDMSNLSLIDNSGIFNDCENLKLIKTPVNVPKEPIIYIDSVEINGETRNIYEPGQAVFYDSNGNSYLTIPTGDASKKSITLTRGEVAPEPDSGIVWDMEKDAWGFGNWSEERDESNIYNPDYVPPMPINDRDREFFTALEKRYEKRVDGEDTESGAAGYNEYKAIWDEYDGNGEEYFVGDLFWKERKITDPARCNGYCWGFAASAISNKMANEGSKDYKFIAEDLHGKKKAFDGESTISCFMLMQWAEAYQNCRKNFMIPDVERNAKNKSEETKAKEREQIEAVIDAAKNVSVNGPALLSYGQDNWGGHAVVITGARGITLDELTSGWFFPDHTYDYVIEIYDSNAMSETGEYDGVSCNMFINRTTNEWTIPQYWLISSSVDTKLSNAYLKCVTTDPNVLYPIHYGNDVSPDGTGVDKATDSDEYKAAVMPDILTVGNNNNLSISYGDWSAVISRKGMTSSDGRGISYYDDAYCEGVENTLPLNVYLPDVPSRETTITPAEGDSSEMFMQLLVGDYYLNVAAEKAGGMTVAEDGSYTVSDNDGAFVISLTSNTQPKDCFCTYTVSGNNKGDFSVSLKEDGGITVSGDDISGITVTAEDIIDEKTETVVIDDKDGDGVVNISGDKEGGSTSENGSTSGNEAENGKILLDGKEVDSLTAAFKQMTDATKDYKIVLGRDVKGEKNLTIPKKAKSVTIIGNGHTVEVVGTKLTANASLTLDDVHFKAVTKKNVPANFTINAKKELTITGGTEVSAKKYTLKAETLKADDTISANVLNCSELVLEDGAVLVASAANKITVKKALKGEGGEIELFSGFKPIYLNGTVSGTVHFTGDVQADGTQLLKASAKKIDANTLLSTFDVDAITENGVDTHLYYVSGGKACIFGEKISYNGKDYGVWKDAVDAMNADIKTAKSKGGKAAVESLSFNVVLNGDVNVNGAFKLPSKGYGSLTIEGNGHSMIFTGDVKLTGNTVFDDLVLKKVDKKGNPQKGSVKPGKYDYKGVKTF